MKNLLLALLGMALTFTAHAQAEPLKLGIVIDTSEPLKVSYVGEDFKRKVQIGALSGLLLTPLGGGLVAGGAVAKQNADFSERLQASIGDSVDRHAIFEKELAEEFAKYTTDIELVFLDAGLLTKGKPDFKRIDGEATPYVVVLEEWAGMATPTLRWGSLAPVTNSKLRVYKAGEKKPLLKENLEGVGPFNDDKDAALDAPESFVDGYPEAVSIAAYHLYWRLNGRNVLHGLAKGTPHADKFPSIEKVLADNAKRFDPR